MFNIKLSFFIMTIMALIGFNNSVLADTNKNTFDHSHSAFDPILKRSVKKIGSKSLVNYSNLKANPEDLNRYTNTLSSISKQTFDKFTNDEQLAFLINAYNAFTLALVRDHYPVSSIKKIGSWFSTPWKINFISLFGEKVSLDDIEHRMIRVWFNEPRIHFVLVCAAKGCPPLRAEPYQAEHLDLQLEDATRSFLNDEDRNYLDLANNRIYLSSILQWYADDFTKNGLTLNSYVAKYMAKNPTQLEAIRGNKIRIMFLDYDWSLNDTK